MCYMYLAANKLKQFHKLQKMLKKNMLVLLRIIEIIVIFISNLLFYKSQIKIFD